MFDNRSKKSMVVKGYRKGQSFDTVSNCLGTVLEMLVMKTTRSGRRLIEIVMAILSIHTTLSLSGSYVPDQHE